MGTFEVGKRLVELCAANEFDKAIDELYAEDCTHVEVVAMPDTPKEVTGKDSLRKMTVEWMANNEIHSSTTTGPYPHGDRFICFMSSDITPKTGPMTGNRMKIDEACLYSVKGGKISRVEFFYQVEGTG